MFNSQRVSIQNVESPMAIEHLDVVPWQKKGASPASPTRKNNRWTNKFSQVCRHVGFEKTCGEKTSLKPRRNPISYDWTVVCGVWIGSMAISGTDWLEDIPTKYGQKYGTNAPPFYDPEIPIDRRAFSPIYFTISSFTHVHQPNMNSHCSWCFLYTVRVGSWLMSNRPCMELDIS